MLDSFIYISNYNADTDVFEVKKISNIALLPKFAIPISPFIQKLTPNGKIKSLKLYNNIN